VQGEILIMGDMTVNGEHLTGVFIECTVEELRASKNMFSERVEIVSADKPPNCPHCRDNKKVDRFWYCEKCGERWY